MGSSLAVEMVTSELCSVAGCSNQAVRSLSPRRLGGYLQLKPSAKKGTLCREHYKQFKKASKEQRRLEMDRYRS